MRYKILRFLRDMTGAKEGTVAPKWIKVVYWILFPLNGFYQRQSGMKYNPLTNMYTIMGQEYSGEIFHFLTRAASQGMRFRLKQHGTGKGIEKKQIIITALTDDAENQNMAQQ